MKYLFFHSTDLKDILRGWDVKPVFKKYARCEIIAEAEGGLVGKCGKLIFILVKKDLDPIYSINVELTKLENGRNSRYGRYVFEEDLKIDATFDDSLYPILYCNN